MTAINIKIDTTKWRTNVLKFQRRVHRNLDREIQATALEIDREAKKNVRVDTGRLRSSIHPQFKSTTGFQYADDEGGFFDGMVQVNIDVFEAIIGTNVQYASKIEKQTPFLEPAVKTAEKNFERRLRNIFK